MPSKKLKFNQLGCPLTFSKCIIYRHGICYTVHRPYNKLSFFARNSNIPFHYAELLNEDFFIINLTLHDLYLYGW